MSIINVLFANLEKDIHHHLDTIRVEMLNQLHAKDLAPAAPAPAPLVSVRSDRDLEEIQRNMENFQESVMSETQRLASSLERMRDDVMTYVKMIESRMEALESHQEPLKSGGLEGILRKSIATPSPVLAASSENMVISNIQHQLVLDDDVVPDDEAIEGELAEQVGGPVVEEVAEEEEEEEEEVIEEVEEVVEETEEAEEEEEAEELELEEFEWKGKTYYKSQHNQLYRATEDGEIEDEPFAEYDPKTNRLTRIS